MELRAIVFDLDGVITDTAEYHYRAWKRLADEEGLAFNRDINEQLRGVSRQASLEIILAGTPVSEARMAELMERKNRYYVEMLEQVTPADILPGAVRLLEELRSAGIAVGLGSASKNARTVLDALGIAGLFDAVADGYSVERTKPAPDLFLKAAELLGAPPAASAVVEDAAAGVDAALAAGMWAIGLGPEARVGHADLRFDSLEGVTLATIREGLEAAAWRIAEAVFDADRQHHSETTFTTGNGHFCLRGDLEEGFPGARPACFMHGLWDAMPINFTELANLPRWWGVDLWIDGTRFRMDAGQVLSYRRWLDLRTGALARTVRWQPAPGGPVVALRFERFASLARRELAAVRVEVSVEEGEAEIRLRTGLNVHVENTGLLHWQDVGQDAQPDLVTLQVHTRSTLHDLALAAVVVVEGPGIHSEGAGDADGQPSAERQAKLRSGETLTLEKYTALVDGGVAPAFEGQAGRSTDAAVALAREAQAKGYAALLAENEAAWARAWETADVVVEGSREAQTALRFNIFQLMIAAPRWSERASIGAKTLSGFGYRHHVFWDTEIFMLPLFVYTAPELARNMLMYRWHNLPGAREKAEAGGFEGAQFPWESAGDGREVTPPLMPDLNDPSKLIRIWPGEIEIHITADVAYAAMQYWQVTGDDAWLSEHGAEMIVEGARFWASALQPEEDGWLHLRDVIGPDEYHDHVDDNAYTNLMARWHLRTALAVLDWLEQKDPARHASLTEALGLTPERLARWGEIAEMVFVPGGQGAGPVEQFTGFFDLEDADLAVLRDPTRKRSMQALLGMDGCAATQNVKQPDVLMLQYLLPGEFTPEQARANYEYYDPRTDHEYGSSLGPAVSSIVAGRMGDAEAAYELFLRAARADLHDVRGNAGDGIHGASAGGVWQAAVFGFAGLRVTERGWETHPRMPAGWTRLAFKFYYHGKLESVDIRA